MRIWDVKTGKPQHLADATGRQITTISVQPQGSLIAAAGVAPRVALWNWKSRQVVHEIDVPQFGDVRALSPGCGARIRRAAIDVGTGN